MEGSQQAGREAPELGVSSGVGAGPGKSRAAGDLDERSMV